MLKHETLILDLHAKNRLFEDHKRKIGDGLCAEVFLTTHNGQDAVIKEFSGVNASLALESEKEALEALESARGVPKLLGVYYDKPPLLLMSYCGENNFEEVIQGRKLPDRVYLSLLCSLAEALSEVHARNYVHNDLKLDNVVIGQDPPDENTRAYLVDYCLARPPGEIVVTASIANGIHEDYEWMPPETFLLRPCQPKGDIWSLGYAIRQVLQTVRWDSCPADLHQVVRKCLQRDSERRPEIQEVRQELGRILESF